MLKLKNLAAMAIAALCIIAFGFEASAQQAETSNKPDFQRGKHKQRMEQMQQQLNLTPQQQEQLKAIHEKTREQAKPLHEQLRANRDKMRELSGNPQANQRAINNLIDENAALKAKMHKLHFEGRTKAKSVLTPEQAQKFDELMPFPPERGEGDFDRPGGPHGKGDCPGKGGENGERQQQKQRGY